MPLLSKAPAPIEPIKKAAGIILMCAVSGMVGAALTRSVGGSSYTMSYADLVSIILTAVSVLLTALAIMLAIAGIIGWSSIEKKVEDGVRENVEQFLSKGFENGGQWDCVIEEKMNKKVEEKASIAMKKVSSEMFLGVEEEVQEEVSGDGSCEENHHDNKE